MTIVKQISKVVFYTILALTPISIYAEIPQCIERRNLKAENRDEQMFIETAYTMSSQYSKMINAIDPNRPFDFCFTKGNANTMYYKRRTSRGIRFSIDDFNESYKYSARTYGDDDDKLSALTANLWILAHEYSHAIDDIIPLGLEEDAGEVAFYNMLHPKAQKLAKQFGFDIFKDKYTNPDGTEVEIQDDFSGEAFADCLGATTIGGASKKFQIKQETEPMNENPIYRMIASRVNAQGNEAFLNRVISVGNSVRYNNDPHGTKSERLMFAKYGWNVGSYYAGEFDDSENLMMTLVYICKIYSAGVKLGNDKRKDDPSYSLIKNMRKFSSRDGY